ncbi:acyltransferase family protein [Burkholderia cenocepacia]|uniref:acyltransferase family protein n=1 Tax=Burkholderia cenocepacia TaxID=95486 RepID=UPI001F4B0B8A|nr:acyltransferase [Burkholderia cenocepacia]
MEKKPFHANYIDGLRAIAVLSVVIYHLNAKWLPGGFAGVDVFFVISGFVVAMSVSELGPIKLHRFLAYFYARRLVRITPALVGMLLVTFLASALFIPEAWLSSSNQKTGLFAFLGLSNFVLSSNTGNYFSPSRNSIHLPIHGHLRWRNSFTWYFPGCSFHGFEASGPFRSACFQSPLSRQSPVRFG